MSSEEHVITIEYSTLREKHIGYCSCGLYKTKPMWDKRKIERAAKAHVDGKA